MPGENRLSQCDKIDYQAVNGLLGVEDSLSYKVHEIEKHFHNRMYWLGDAAASVAETHHADRAGPGIAGWTLTSGNDAYNATWTQILGSADTPIHATGAKFDPGAVLVTAANSTSPYVIQFVSGESAGIAAKVSAEDITETMTISVGGAFDAGGWQTMSPRIDATTKLWARCICIGQDAKTVTFYLGLHEYVG